MGAASQRIQWSSEYNDSELGLVYYNYRHYNPSDGRWIGRDYIPDAKVLNLYRYAWNGVSDTDFSGMYPNVQNIIEQIGDFEVNDDCSVKESWEKFEKKAI